MSGMTDEQVAKLKTAMHAAGVVCPCGGLGSYCGPCLQKAVAEGKRQARVEEHAAFEEILKNYSLYDSHNGLDYEVEFAKIVERLRARRKEVLSA